MPNRLNACWGAALDRLGRDLEEKLDLLHRTMEIFC